MAQGRLDSVVWLGLIRTAPSRECGFDCEGTSTLKIGSIHIADDWKRPPSGGRWILRSGIALVAIAVSSAGYCQSTQIQTRDAVLQNSDVRVQLHAGIHAPSLISLDDLKGHRWHNRSEEALPAAVEVKGVNTQFQWILKPELSSIGKESVEFVYEIAHSKPDLPRLRVRWKWESRATHGPLEHTIVVENLGDAEMWLPLIDSMRMDWQVPATTALLNFSVEKGADSPSAEGTHVEPIEDGYRWVGRSSTYGHPVAGEAREIIPVQFVYEPRGEQPGWYAGIEFSGRTLIALERNGDHLKSRLGLNGEAGGFRTRLEAKGSFTTPAVFLGSFGGGVDEGSNQLRAWVREVLNNPATRNDPQYPLLVSNSWGSGMQVDEALARRMMTDAQELGLEMFHLDAGWFRGVGDWYPDEKKFPHGLAALADEAHRHGLRFGMWVDWSQAGVDTSVGALNVHASGVNDWLVNDVGPAWKPEEFKGQTIDLGVPAAHDYAAKEVKRIVEDYHLDMLEHDGYLVAQGCIRDDHPHAAPNRSSLHILHDSGFDFVESSNSTDVSYHAVQSYYDIYEQLRRTHPALLLEICNDGGRMMDFGSAAHGDYFSITDTYDPLSNRRAFYDTSYALPSAMLESYVEKWPAPEMHQFLYMLRSGMMGWMTIMLDTTTWSAEQHDAAKHSFALYKEKLRPLIRNARLYHVSERPDGIRWDGMEYWDALRKRGVLYAFRGSVANEPEHVFVLMGLDPAKTYRLHFEDGTSPDRQATGAELMSSGLALRLTSPFSSELVFLDEIV